MDISVQNLFVVNSKLAPVLQTITLIQGPLHRHVFSRHEA